MSEDWVVRTPRPVGLKDLVRATPAALSHLAVRGDSSKNWVVLVDARDRSVVWVSTGRDCDGEVHTEVSTTMGTNVPPYRTTEAMARDVAQGLAAHCGGRAERLSGATAPGDAMDAVIQPDEADGPSEGDDCPVDVVTEKVAVLVQTRPHVTLTSWVRAGVTWALKQRKRFVLLAPAACVLSPSLTDLLRDAGALWVVDAGTCRYDGFSGRAAAWDGVEFVLDDSPEPVDAFRPSKHDTWRVTVNADTTHPYHADTSIGMLAKSVCEVVGVEPPEALDVVEPLGYAFDPETVTTAAQESSPDPVRFTLAGAAVDGVLRLVPQPVGLVESVHVVADGQPTKAPDRWDGVAEAALAAGIQTLAVQFTRGVGRFTSARLNGPTVPVLVVVDRARYATLSDEEVLALGGPRARLINSPRPALVVPFDTIFATDGEPTLEPAALGRYLNLWAVVADHDEQQRLQDPARRR